MTKSELIEAIEDLDDDAEVTLALQPNYPLTADIRNVCLKRNGDGKLVGAVIACGDGMGYTTSVWWGEYDVTVGDDGEPAEDCE